MSKAQKGNKENKKPKADKTQTKANVSAYKHQLIRLNQQFRFHRPGIPDPGRDEVVQLIVITKCNPLRHRLNALAVARTDLSPDT